MVSHRFTVFLVDAGCLAPARCGYQVGASFLQMEWEGLHSAGAKFSANPQVAGPKRSTVGLQGPRHVPASRGKVCNFISSALPQSRITIHNEISSLSRNPLDSVKFARVQFVHGPHVNAVAESGL